LRAAYDRALGEVDVLVMPTLPLRPTVIPPPDVSREEYCARALEMIPNTAPFDVTGHPAISVPCHSAGSLPVGRMIIGRHGAAALLGVLFAVSALVGMVAAVAVSGTFEALPCGAGVGAHLAFAAFGARTEVACRSAAGAALALSFLPLFWALTGALATEAA